MRRKNIIMILFALALALMIPDMVLEAKEKPKLTANKKSVKVGQTYRLKLEGVPHKAKVNWKTSKKSVVSIAKKKGNIVILKAKKKEWLWLRLYISKRNISAELRSGKRKRHHQIILN